MTFNIRNCLKDSKFVWTTEVEHAFEEIKGKVTTILILVLLNFEQPFELHVDASIGVALSQNNRSISYFSEKLSSTKLHYSTYVVELCNVIQAIKHWSQLDSISCTTKKSLN